MPWNMSWNCNMCVFLVESVPPEEHCPSHCRNWSLLARWSTLISWLLARPGTSNGHSGDQDWLGPLLGIVNRPMYRCCDALRMVSWVPAVSSANFDILYRLYTKVDMFDEYYSCVTTWNDRTWQTATEVKLLQSNDAPWQRPRDVWKLSGIGIKWYRPINSLYDYLLLLLYYVLLFLIIYSLLHIMKHIT